MALLTGVGAAGAVLITSATVAFAAHPHFLYASVTGSVTANSITVSFKEAGLGNSLSSVNISVTGTAECINGGGRHPKAENKTAEGAGGTFNVSNGQATGSLTMTADNISPPCDPPMTIAWTNIVVTDSTFGDSISIPGTFYPTG
ncbi:MAG: hypothetical protein ACREN2_10130 [Candidatus Dormibacteria bacterium]